MQVRRQIATFEFWEKVTALQLESLWVVRFVRKRRLRFRQSGIEGREHVHANRMGEGCGIGRSLSLLFNENDFHLLGFDHVWMV